MKKYFAAISVILAVIYLLILIRITFRWSLQEGLHAAYPLFLPLFPLLGGLSLFRINSELSPRFGTVWTVAVTVIILTVFHLVVILRVYPNFLRDGIYVWSYLIILPFRIGLPSILLAFIIGSIADFIRNNR
jgi:hypothetical protein